jgi:hypothetical protein
VRAALAVRKTPAAASRLFGFFVAIDGWLSPGDATPGRVELREGERSGGASASRTAPGGGRAASRMASQAAPSKGQVASQVASRSASGKMGQVGQAASRTVSWAASGKRDQASQAAS